MPVADLGSAAIGPAMSSEENSGVQNINDMDALKSSMDVFLKALRHARVNAETHLSALDELGEALQAHRNDMERWQGILFRNQTYFIRQRHDLNRRQRASADATHEVQDGVVGPPGRGPEPEASTASADARPPDASTLDASTASAGAESGVTHHWL